MMWMTTKSVVENNVLQTASWERSGMSARVSRASLTGLVMVWWLLVVVAGAIVISLALFGWMNGHPVQAEQARSAPVLFPAESVMPAVPSPTVPPVSAVIPEPTAVTTSSPPTPVSVMETAVLPFLTVGDAGVNVRTGPGTDYARIGALEPGAYAEIRGWHDGWWQITYEGSLGWVAGWLVVSANTDDVPEAEPPPLPPIEVAPSPTPVLPPAAPGEIDEGRWIDVDLSEQLLVAYESHIPVRTMLVSTGLPSTPTPTGQFRIWIKFRYDDMEGPGYFIEDVPFVMYFHKGYGLHGVTWHGNFGHPMSHGCVNLPAEEAEWLFNWTDVGTLVNVHI